MRPWLWQGMRERQCSVWRLCDWAGCVGFLAPVTSERAGSRGGDAGPPHTGPVVSSAVEDGFVLIRNRGSLVALVCGAVLALTGCQSSSEGTAAPSTPSVAPEVPVGFEPCTDVPQEVLASEELRSPRPDDSSAGGGIKWNGCTWRITDGYTAGIRTTNMTLEMVKVKNFPEEMEFVAGGRKAISTRQLEAHAEASCIVNVEMNGGSLEFMLSNPSSNRKTGHLDTCELARNLASKVAPSIPAGV